jgi:hypothetical protein
MLTPSPSRVWTARRWRGAMAVVVGVFLLLLTPLSYLEQPDPLWIGGIWDDDDADAIVVLVKSTEIPCDSTQSVFIPLEPCLYGAPTPPVWRPIALSVRWPENRAPPDV